MRRVVFRLESRPEPGPKTLRHVLESVFRRIFREKIEFYIFILVTVFYLAFGAYLVWRWGATYISDFMRFSGTGGDALSQLYRPRMVLEYAKLANLGTVWLPFFNMLLIPFVPSDFLYTTGYAATIVNSAVVASTCVLLYRFVEHRAGGLLAAGMYAANPYTIVHGVIPHSMALAGFLIVLSLFYFRRYVRTDSTKDFMSFSLAGILASLTRYESWILLLAAILLFLFRERQRPHRIVFGSFVFWGVLGWLFYNAVIFKDPFIWVYGPFPGAGGFYANVGARALLLESPLKLNVFFGLTMVMGLLWVLLVPVGALVFLKQTSRKDLYVVLIILALVAYFVKTLPDVPEAILNRGPFVILASTIAGSFLLLQSLNRRRKLLLGAGVLALYLTSLGLSVPLLVGEVWHPAGVEYLVGLKQEMSMVHDATKSGTVLAVSASNLDPARTLSVLYGQTRIISEFSLPLFTYASREPWRYVDYVIVNKMDPSNPAVKDTLQSFQQYYTSHFLYYYYYDGQWRAEFVGRYHPILETESLLVFASTVRG